MLQSLVLGVHQELQLHSSYAAKWGVDVADEELQPSPATAAYCRFLMDVVEDPQVGRLQLCIRIMHAESNPVLC